MEVVYAWVRQIPVGKVVTYGQVAASIEGISLTARQVGAALRWVPPDVPWQRVVGAGGTLPIGKRDPALSQKQRLLLASEGVAFLSDAPDRVDLARSQWLRPANTQPGLFSDDTGQD